MLWELCLHTRPLSQVTFKHRDVCDPRCFSSISAANLLPALGMPPLGSASLQVSLNRVPSWARAPQKPWWCCLGTAVGATGYPLFPRRNLTAKHGPGHSPQWGRHSNALCLLCQGEVIPPASFLHAPEALFGSLSLMPPSKGSVLDRLGPPAGECCSGGAAGKDQRATSCLPGFSHLHLHEISIHLQGRRHFEAVVTLRSLGCPGWGRHSPHHS